jgi:two-component system, LuxR family, response regulator DctR
MTTAPGLVHIVDDDEAIRGSLHWLITSRGLQAKSYDSAHAFLASYRLAADQVPECLLLDIRMEGMSGLELQDALPAHGIDLPIVFLTGHADVPLAVTALKKGAVDFLEKPFNDNDLVDRIIECIAAEQSRIAKRLSRASVEHRLAQLSGREQEVMNLVLAGKLNKVIADELAISMRTVEVHRARVLAKMGVKTAVELAQVIATKSSGK